MSLNYETQSTFSVIGSKTSAFALTAVALPTYYNFDGTTTKPFEAGGYATLELTGTYTAGADETANSLQVIIESSTDRTNWARVLNETVSDGTSTLNQREFTIVQSIEYGTLVYDAQSANFAEGLKVTGGTSGATAYIETDVDGGTTGTLTLSNISGVFEDNETITDSSTGSATVKGILTSITAFSLPFDISSKYLRISVKETGVVTNAGDLYLEATLSGK